jgi:putative phosphoesterase
MRVGLLSDTHIPKAKKRLPAELLKAFQGVDLILHAGDIFIPSVLDDLEGIAPVFAAIGDDDHGDILMDKRVKGKHILKIDGYTLWLLHIKPYYPLPQERKSNTSSGQDNSPHIVVFGHEHYPLVRRVGDTLFVNPGSPTFLYYRRGLGTAGILDIDANRVDAQILHL